MTANPTSSSWARPSRSQFEKAEDKIGTVWLPVFKPTAEKKTGPQPVDEIAPQDFGKHVSPMLTKEKFEDAAAITGIGMSKIGRRLMVPPLSLTIDACERRSPTPA